MPEVTRRTSSVDRWKAVGRIAPAVLALILLAFLMYELREGWEQADHVASVVAAVLAAVLVVAATVNPLLQRKTATESVDGSDLIVIREDIKNRREDEAQRRGLLKGLMLPITIGDVELEGDGDVHPPATVSGAARLFTWLRPARVDVSAEDQTLLWDYDYFTTRWAKFVWERYKTRTAGGAAEPVRMVVHGTGGVGKTTLALMLTLGLVRRDATTQSGVCTDDVTPVPLLVPLSDYDGRLPFTRWINRKARRLYPALERITVGPRDTRGLVGRLLNVGRAVLILDGWDEMPSAVREQAAEEIGSFLRDTESIIIFSRARTADDVKERIGALAGSLEIIAVNRPTMAQRQAYLRHRARSGGMDGERWEPSAVERLAVELDQRPELAGVLSTPMMLDLAARGVGRGNLTVEDLAETAGNDKENATRSSLLHAHIGWALKDFPRPVKVLTHHRSPLWLTYLAHVMTHPGRDVVARSGKPRPMSAPADAPVTLAPSYQLSWWRAVGRAPRTVLAVASALSLLPAYWLALQMPVGLTRGLAIGIGVGIGAAFMRARPMGWPALPLVWLLITGEVLLVGTLLRDPTQAVVDALEIASSVAAAYLVLDTLLRSRWPRRIGRQPRWAAAFTAWAARRWRRGLLAGAQWVRPAPGWIALPWRWTVLVPARRAPRLIAPILMTLVTGFIGWVPPVLYRYLIDFDDPERKVTMVYVGTTLGIGLATIAARAYITKEETIPDEVRVTLKTRVEPGIHALLVAVLFATSIGLGGAVGGWMRYDFGYAVAALAVFWFVAGIPVGLVGGLIKWLCSPLVQPKNASVEGSGVAGPAAVTEAEDEAFTRPESVVTVRDDRRLAIGILASITVVAAASMWAMQSVLAGPIDHIRASAAGYAIGFEDAPLVALTLGVIVACTYTVWPAFLFAHLWLVARRELPWQLQVYASELQEARIIIRDGDTYKFRYAGLRTYLGEELYYDLRPHLAPREVEAAPPLLRE